MSLPGGGAVLAGHGCADPLSQPACRWPGGRSDGGLTPAQLDRNTTPATHIRRTGANAVILLRRRSLVSVPGLINLVSVSLR